MAKLQQKKINVEKGIWKYPVEKGENFRLESGKFLENS